MAENDKKAAAKKPTPTQYIVLQAVAFTGMKADWLKAIGLPEFRGNFTGWMPVLNAKAAQGPDGQPRIFTAASKTAAIRQYTGDGESVIEGSWKAVPLSSWKGGEQTKRVTAAERLPLEEAMA